MWTFLSCSPDIIFCVIKKQENDQHLSVCGYLVGAVDLGSVLQQEMDNLSVASTCRPDNGVDAVL